MLILFNCCVPTHVAIYRDLYIAGAGIDPATTVPICLDLGTNTQRFLDDPLYIGARRRRPDVQEARISKKQLYPFVCLDYAVSLDGSIHERIHGGNERSLPVALGSI